MILCRIFPYSEEIGIPDEYDNTGCYLDRILPQVPNVGDSLYLSDHDIWLLKKKILNKYINGDKNFQCIFTDLFHLCPPLETDDININHEVVRIMYTFSFKYKSYITYVLIDHKSN